jgi:hypothetical protein
MPALKAQVVQADDESRVVVPGASPHAEYAVLVDKRGDIHLIPLDHLDEDERAVYLNQEFLQDTIDGLNDVTAGRVKPLDWVLDGPDE